MNQAHGDVVYSVDESIFEVMAQSPSGIEIFVSKDHRVLAIQGHPEYEVEWNKY
jgi:GMP synthase-like glutamine amidotransferase